MKDRKVWLTVKGSRNSKRNKETPGSMPKYLEGVVVDTEPHYKDQSYWMRIQWTNGQFGTYYNDEGLVTPHKPKALSKKRKERAKQKLIWSG